MPRHSFICNSQHKNRERALLVLHISYAGTWVHATNQKCQLKSDRFNYKRDSVGIISVTRVSRLHKTRFTKKNFGYKAKTTTTQQLTEDKECQKSIILR